MDHTTQTETEFIDAIETPHEELANEHPEQLAPPLEAVIPEVTEEKEDAAKRRAIKMAASTMKALKRNKRPGAANTNSPQADAAQDAPSSQEAAAEQITTQKAQVIVVVSESETAASEIEQPEATEEGEIVQAEEPGEEAGQSVETIELAEPASTEEEDDANTPTRKLGEIDATPIIAEQAETVAIDTVEAVTEQAEVIEIDTVEVVTEQAEVTEIDTIEAVAEQTEIAAINAVEVVAEQTAVAEMDTIEAVAEQAEITAINTVEVVAEQTAIAEMDTVEAVTEQAAVAEVVNDAAPLVVEQTESATIKTTAKLAEMDTIEAGDERGEFAEIDTMEVARAEVQEDWRRRIAATKTIQVPAIILEVLEKADIKLPTWVAPKTAETSPAPVERPGDEEQQTMASGELETTAALDAWPTQTMDTQRRNSRQLAAALPLKTPTRSLSEESRYRITGSQAAIKHSVVRRWGRQTRKKQHKRWVKIVSAAVVASILVSLCIPLAVALMGYTTYNNIKGVATDGISHLMAIKALVPANKNDITSVLTTKKLAQAQDDLSKAQDDFLQLQGIVNRPDIQSLTEQFAPQYSSKIDMARNLVQVALDVSHMGQELIGVARMGANILNGGALLSTSSNTPLISTNDINAVEAALVHGQYYINDISAHMAQVDLTQLPFGTPSQKNQLSNALSLIPQAQNLITQAQGMVEPVSWLLGVGQQRRFLVQTLDRGELRPSGGFEGQYGVLTLQNGRMSPFSLTDVAQIDYNGDGYDINNHPPTQYKWMDFGNFGLRDANLSADYPTDARFIMDLFQKEGGGPVDGDIQITPVVIEQVLQITGPLQVKEYNETVTAQNLEEKIHAYQQDYRLIGVEAQKTGSYTHDTRKAFTSLLGQMLLDKVKHLHVKDLMALSKSLLQDLKSRDLQIYFTNPLAEQWLVKNNYSGAMPQFNNGTDGFMVVQANISISKAAQFVHSTFADNVTLDAQGGATHNLTITLKYNQTGPVYGFNSYADYLRVYTPANAQFISGNGFNTGQILCTPNQPKPKPTPTPNPNPKPNPTPNPPGGPSDSTGSYTDAGHLISGCGAYYHSYPDSDQRSCPDGNYELGYNGMQSKPWPIQKVGAPKQFGSDLPGYNMWAGMTLTPKNCTSTITLSWYVPHIVQHTLGQAPYQMIVGHQAGWPVTAQVNVNASALNDKNVKSFSYNQTINVDTQVALPARPLPPTPKPTTPTPAVTPTGTTKKP